MNSDRLPPCDVALLVDEETGAPGRAGRFVPAPRSVEQRVARALRRRYRRVEIVPFAPSVVPTIERLRQLAPRVVFNLTEWVDGDRRLDAAIAGVLEIMKLPYTGTGPDGLGLSRDKALARSIVSGLGVPVPRAASAADLRPKAGRKLPYPLIVKPRFGDGSDAISGSSVVETAGQLARRLRMVGERGRRPVVCEEFIAGRDLYVGLVGPEPRVLPPVELVVRRSGRGAPVIATYHLKTNRRYRTRWGVHYRPARLDPPVLVTLAAACRRVFHALKLRDYARLDFRLTPGGVAYFIEANPNPDLDPYSLNRSGCFAGLAYGDLIGAIVESARRRRQP